jgi:hypothetical protein
VVNLYDQLNGTTITTSEVGCCNTYVSGVALASGRACGTGVSPVGWLNTHLLDRKWTRISRNRQSVETVSGFWNLVTHQAKAAVWQAGRQAPLLANLVPDRASYLLQKSFSPHQRLRPKITGEGVWKLEGGAKIEKPLCFSARTQFSAAALSRKYL